VHTLLIMTCETEWQAMEYEGRWGAHYQPRYNVEGYRHTAAREVDEWYRGEQDGDRPVDADWYRG